MTPEAPPAAPARHSGLTAAEVASRRASGQVNVYVPATSRTTEDIIRANVATRFNALLGALFVVILVVGPVQDALFGLTILANTGVGIGQELRAKRTLDGLRILAAPLASVIRAGELVQVRAADLVIDDLLELAAGDQAVVDAVVLSTRSARIDESMLTGESHAVTKSPGDQILSGSFVTSGSATCQVVAVGAGSYAARLAEEARRFTAIRSELRDGINLILRVVTWFLVPVAILLVWSQFARAGSFADAVRGSVAGTVTMVPEGLVLLCTVAFALGAMRLARHHVLAQELPSIEGLARTDTLCIDKTGTLTTGRLVASTLTRLHADVHTAEAFGALARLEQRPNATALAVAAAFPAPDWQPSNVVPFDSATKWSGADFGPYGSWLWGAPDVLLPIGHPALALAEQAAADGARVLLLARSPSTPPTGKDPQPVALISLADELRTDAAETLEFLAQQGIRVKVISGDHPATVAALVRRLGLDPGEPVDAQTLLDADLATVAEQRMVFGRVTPSQKRDLVRALQAAGHTVAMTGDGINDVLALKEAHVGIAMGSGAAATRAVAQLVLLDDAFTAMPAVIAEGRRVIANVERVANLFITKTVYATVLAITVGIARLPFPFLPRHLTLVSTFTLGIPAFFLALAPNDRIAKPHFVARVARFALPAGLGAAGATYLAYSQAMQDDQTSVTGARTLATIVLCLVALWILVLLMRLGDGGQTWVVPAMGACLVLFLSVPSLRTFFALEVPRPLVLLAGVGAAAFAGIALELGWTITGWLRPIARGRRT